MIGRRRISSLSMPVLVIGWIALCGGCLNKAGPEWAKKVAFWENDDVDPRGTVSPAKQMEELQALRKSLPTSGLDVQQAKAAELAQRYRNESDPILRGQIVRTIGLCGSPAAGETLRAAMFDSEPDVRILACTAWGDHGGPMAVPALSEALRKDKSKDVRMAAARALGRIGGPDVVAALAPALDDPDPALQYRAVQAMRASSGKDFGDEVGAWREFARGGSPKEISTAQRMKLDYF